MTLKTFSHHDTLSIASGLQSIADLIDNITTDGVLDPKYHYLYDDLFVVFYKVYHDKENEYKLDNSISDAKHQEINKYFGKAQYHMSVAIGLAAGIITAVGVSFEINHSQAAAKKAKENINDLQENSYQIVQADTTRRYVNALQKATADPKININELVKTLFWTIIVGYQPVQSIQDFQDALSSIHLGILNERHARWAGVFSLENKSINMTSPGEGDDTKKITTIVSELGNLVGVATIVVMAVNWKANGVSPFQSFAKIFQGVKATFSGPISDEDAAGDLATAEVTEEVTAEFSVTDALGGALGVIGAALLIIGTIVAIIDLSKAKRKIDKAKKQFNDQYGSLRSTLLTVIGASEGFRKHSSS